MSRTVLALFAGGWGVFGVVSFIAPAAVLGGFGIELSEADAVAEIRAMYTCRYSGRWSCTSSAIQSSRISSVSAASPKRTERGAVHTSAPYSTCSCE